MRRFLLLLSLVCCVTLPQAQAKEAPTFEPARVVASFPILADMIREIGGEHVVVETLVAEGQDAHSFQPTPDDAKKLAGAQIIAINGLKFELWMGRLIKASGSKAKLLVATAGLKPRVLMEDEHNDEAAQGHHHHDHEKGEITPDPHAWQDLGNAPIYIKNITAALIEAKPAYADFYKQRARNFLNECAKLDAQIKEDFAAIPQERRKVITSHDAFGYYGAAYGVTFLAPVGISTEEEPSAASLSKLIEQVKAEKVRALFVESMASPRLMQQIAEETGAKIGGTLYADTLTAADNEAATYLDLMRLNSSRLLAAMKD
ncbi:MAG: zinc ABC transporter substrate-binding protein [Alphaproteobacteria bacterium]|nr:zinc ABC transporter substrate-binding protein [Alphaproteobacteria bacterium]